MLSGKTAIITGGARGIGKGIAKLFCQNGANVLLCYRSNKEEAERTKAELEKIAWEIAGEKNQSDELGEGQVTPSKVELFAGDVALEQTAKDAVARAKELFGKVDILVNNAGITGDKLLIKMTGEDFRKVIDANLNGSFYFLKEVSSVMMKQRSGVIINMSSIAGLLGNPAQINYSASKAGVIGMTKSAAKELGRRNIRVNAIAPGFIETDMTAILTEEQKKMAAASISLGRMGIPEDIAKVALFLASDMGAYVTGQVISVDGGLTI